jgi:hypothetical protein
MTTRRVRHSHENWRGCNEGNDANSMPGLNGRDIAVVIQESRGLLPAIYPSDPSTAEQFGQFSYELVRTIGSPNGEEVELGSDPLDAR